MVSDGQTQAQIDSAMEEIINDNKEIFQGMGRAKVPPIHIQVKDNAVPITQGKRPIPLQLREATLKKLKELKDHDLIEGPLPTSECTGWITNMVVTKKRWNEDEVRINIDTKRMNEHLVPTKVPIPTPEQLRHKFHGSDHFTAVDCRDSYFHFLLDPESQNLFKFHGEDGVYRFKVLVMGTPPASGECHNAMAYILQGLKGVVQIKDDIVVHGKGREHDQNLRALLKRLHEYGIRLRREKCKFGKQAIIWFGHVFSKQGMSADSDKVAHIKAWPAPTNKEEVKSFLQTVQFVAAFMRDDKGTPHSDVTAPLRRLTHQNVRFEWTKACQQAFEELKRRISDKTVLVPYVPDLETRLYVDHGPEGIASTVAQHHTKGDNPGWKAVHYKSRSLIPAETNYSKVEGESLAIYSGVKMNRQYLYGTNFTVMTDHSALPSLYNTTRPAPHRVERHRGRLGSFQFKVQFVPGNKHPCDYGSCHPDPLPKDLTKQQMEEWGIEDEEADEEIWVNRVLEQAIPAVPQAPHHKEARKRDREAKQATKERYDKKHRVRQQDLQLGDRVYRRREKTTSTKGPWETQPFTITKIRYNQITGTRDHTNSRRDRADWKLVKTRPKHLRLPN